MHDLINTCIVACQTLYPPLNRLPAYTEIPRNPSVPQPVAQPTIFVSSVSISKLALPHSPHSLHFAVLRRPRSPPDFVRTTRKARAADSSDPL